MYVCMYVCIMYHVCMYVCMYVCMHACMYIYIYICMCVLVKHTERHQNLNIWDRVMNLRELQTNFDDHFLLKPCRSQHCYSKMTHYQWIFCFQLLIVLIKDLQASIYYGKDKCMGMELRLFLSRPIFGDSVVTFWGCIHTRPEPHAMLAILVVGATFRLSTFAHCA